MTPVRSTFAPCRRDTIMSCWGPMAFFSTPRISTRNSSGATPWNTVLPVPIIPGRSSAGSKKGGGLGSSGAGPAATRPSATRAAQPSGQRVLALMRRLFPVLGFQALLDRFHDVILHGRLLLAHRFVHQAWKLQGDLNPVLGQSVQPPCELLPAFPLHRLDRAAAVQLHESDFVAQLEDYVVLIVIGKVRIGKELHLAGRLVLPLYADFGLLVAAHDHRVAPGLEVESQDRIGAPVGVGGRLQGAIDSPCDGVIGGIRISGHLYQSPWKDIAVPEASRY